MRQSNLLKEKISLLKRAAPLRAVLFFFIASVITAMAQIVIHPSVSFEAFGLFYFLLIHS